MQTGTSQLYFGIRLLTFIFLLPFLFSNCDKNPVEIPEDDVFTKEKREQLGQLLMNDILANHDFLPQVPPYDSSYWYIQTIYHQATTHMRKDLQSPVDNRWSGNWDVYIIDDYDARHAFILPGGDLFITTGMLQSFKKTYELFYLLTFEAVLMHENHLLNALKNEYNSLTLINLIEGRATPSAITITDLANDFPEIHFEGGTIYEADRQTVASICQTSTLEPTGINPSLTNPNFEDAEWLICKPSYGARTQTIQGFADDNSGDCGGHLEGNFFTYKQYVLDVLD